MGQGRWYPTLVALPDGDVLAVSGLGADGFLSLVPERYDGAGWTALPMSPPWPMYAPPVPARRREAVLQRRAVRGEQRPAARDLEPGRDTVVQVDGLPEPGFRNQSASVLLPPAQDQQVMIIGGGGADIHAVGATATSAIADLDRRIADLRCRGPPMHHPRMHLCATLLPDRTVLVNGGSGMEESHQHVSPHAEIYHPDTNSWPGAAASRVDRLYHSVALLMPDGKVVTAGSNPERKDEERRIEVFWPPYLFAGPRPSVVLETEQVHYGGTVVASVADPADLREASLLRPGATTHSCDTEQRLVDLPLQVTGHDAVALELPASASLAPPGWYQLVVVSAAGVPSEGVWIHLS